MTYIKQQFPNEIYVQSNKKNNNEQQRLHNASDLTNRDYNQCTNPYKPLINNGQLQPNNH